MTGEERRYDLAVIGAGITGLTSAYHIKKENPDLKVVVADRSGSYAQGNTGRATAGFRDLFSSDINFNLANSSIGFYRNVQESKGHDMGMKFVGYMFLLNEEGARLEVLEEVRHKTRVSTMDNDELSEIKSLIAVPQQDEAAVLGIKPVVSAYIGLNCGIFEPDMVTSYYYSELQKMGVEFMFNTTALRLEMVPGNPLDYPGEPFLWQDKKIGRIETDKGHLSADFYIIAADVWSDGLLDPIGVDSHIRPRKRQVFQVGGQEVEGMLKEFSVDGSGIFPFTILPHYGVHFRPAPKERQLRVCAPDYLGRDFSIEEFPEAEKNYYEYSIKPVLQAYFPSLGNSRLGGSWAGYYSYNTIDAHPYIFREMNMIVATGTSGSGLMKGDAIGRVAASLYSGREKTRLFNGAELMPEDLGIRRRNVPPERFVL